MQVKLLRALQERKVRRVGSGETVTVQQVFHETTLGARQRDTKLNVEVESSLGTDFVIQLDPEAKADISSLNVDGRSNPVRFDGTKLIVPLRPGRQMVEVAWKTSQTLDNVAAVESYTEYSLFSNEVFKKGWPKHYHEWDTVGSDRPYHYLGSGAFFVRLGDSFAKAMAELIVRQKK